MDSFTLVAPANQAPYTPSEPDPAHGASDVPLTQTLRWQGGDPDGDPVTYTVCSTCIKSAETKTLVSFQHFCYLILTVASYNSSIGSMRDWKRSGIDHLLST